MNHIERYIEVLKRREMQPAVSSVPLNVDLPGLKHEPGLSKLRHYELRGERKGLLKFIETEEKKLKKLKGEEKKALTLSIRGAKAKLKELSLILGPLKVTGDAE
jgi:hypothetical protein